MLGPFFTKCLAAQEFVLTIVYLLLIKKTLTILLHE